MRHFPPVSLIGAPTDIGAGDRGASMGPEALRVAGITEALHARGLDIVDRGNLFGPLNPWLPPSAGYRHLVQVIEWNREVMRAVTAELTARRMPILLGGDHCLAIGSITAVARHCHAQGLKLRILWLDAHADFNTSTITPSGNIHGMPVACLCGYGPRELTELGGSAPAIDAECIRQIGIRSVDAGEKRLVHDVGLGLDHADGDGGVIISDRYWCGESERSAARTRHAAHGHRDGRRESCEHGARGRGRPERHRRGRRAAVLRRRQPASR